MGFKVKARVRDITVAAGFTFLYAMLYQMAFGKLPPSESMLGFFLVFVLIALGVNYTYHRWFKRPKQDPS